MFWTKKQLIEALKDYKDTDTLNINIHDDVFYDDNYDFKLDPIHMGLDEHGKDRGFQIWICPIQNEIEEVVTVEQAQEAFEHYYEVDLGNCEMLHKDWIRRLAEAASTEHRHRFWNDFINGEYREYLEEINA